MASNGVILLNLNNRNAADFQRLEVPDSYEKASGALTAGTYVTVYKWLYQGFMMAPSLCDAVDATDHINLVDRTNGGILEVYPDDTIKISSEPTPEPPEPPEPLTLVPLTVSEPGVYDPSDYDADGFNEVTVLSAPPRATRVWTHSTGGTNASVYMQSGTYENGVFAPSGEAVDVVYTGANDWVGHGIVQVKYAGSWSVRGVIPLQFDGNSYIESQVITTWAYSTSVDYLFIEISSGLDFPEFNMGGVDFVAQSFGPSNIHSLISSAVEVSFIVMAFNFSVEGSSKGVTPTSVSKFNDMENTTFYTMENEYFKYSASENAFGQSYVEFYIKEE